MSINPVPAPHPDSRPAAVRHRARQARVFVLKFAGCTAGFFALSLLPVWPALLSSLLGGYAWLASVLLNLFGAECHTLGAGISSAGYAVNVHPDCSALEYAGFLCAAVLSFPAPARSKLLVILAGGTILLAANLIRIASLYWIGVHFPPFFETAHGVIWPGLLVVITVLVCAIWFHRVASPANPANPANPADSHAALAI